MSFKRSVFVPGALALLGTVFALGLATPASHAEQAVRIKPAEDMEMPEGSQIPESRREEAKEKLREYRARMKAKSSRQRQEAPPQADAPKPKGEGPN